ncbi:MAG TPA: SDR family NAD(P)-dependent oxidoreductase [Polyangia bacterium]|jgi:NAD(P)-dependent dehydrogenase (short-subunit alcohol dehydrogenase family)
MKKRIWFAAAIGGGILGWRAARRAHVPSLRGRVAVVTGATRGLGERIATELAEAGCPLAICARDEHEVKEAGLRLAGHGTSVMARRVDVSDPVAVDAFIDEVEAHFGRVDILVNNAGIIQAGPLEDMTLADFRECLAIDFWGVVYASLAALPGMRRRRAGVICNVTSIGAEISVPHLLPYSCAKAAARAFSEGLTAELAGSGVRALTVVPWLMRTGSIPYVFFKGAQEAEYALFAKGQRRFVSVDADRAARRIVRAIARGETHLSIGSLASIFRQAHALAPGLLARLFGQARRLMPRAGAGPVPTMAVRGTTLAIR